MADGVIQLAASPNDQSNMTDRNVGKAAVRIHTMKCSFSTPSKGLTTSGKVVYKYCWHVEGLESLQEESS